MSVNQAQCGAHPHCVPENTDTGYGIEKRITHNFFLKNNLDKLAPVESKNQDRAIVGQSMPLRGEPFSG